MSEQEPIARPNPNSDLSPVTVLSEAAIKEMVEVALTAFETASDSASLKAAKTDHVGEGSRISLANRQIGTLPPQERREVGARIGAARAQINQVFAERSKQLAEAELTATLVAEHIDMTLPVEVIPQGALHPITALIEQMTDIFLAMGWEVAEGPELEAEWYNFDALNLPESHPARALQDTLWIDPPQASKLLRTQTSPVQIRALLNRDLPVYVVSPGKVFRADEYDATHLPVFHQIEGLCVDKGISMADLRGTLDHFAKAMFGEVKTRMRPHYFPFTEPSAEVDLECFVCHGESVGNPQLNCRTCRNEGWIEWGGCGVVNPRVLAACGVDTTVYTGFAFGMGIDRTVMFRNNAPDLRDFVEGDVRFSRSLLGGAR